MSETNSRYGTRLGIDLGIGSLRASAEDLWGTGAKNSHILIDNSANENWDQVCCGPVIWIKRIGTENESDRSE